MTIQKGRAGSLYAWNGVVTAMSGEACTEATIYGQITDTAKRLISPNHTQTFVDSGGKTVIRIDYVNGIATFNGTVANVTCDGNYIASSDVPLIAQIYGWKLDSSIDIKDGTCLGDTSKVKITDLKDWKGTIDAFWLSSAWWDKFREASVGGTVIYKYFLKLYINATQGYKGFAVINGIGDSVPVGDLVKQTITFEGDSDLTFF
jgi:hypothetical protein